MQAFEQFEVLPRCLGKSCDALVSVFHPVPIVRWQRGVKLRFQRKGRRRDPLVALP